jgi:CheY-like chemotaxis protein
VTRILCVEDNEDNIYLVKMRLEMIEGFDITVAKDGAEGVNLAATGSARSSWRTSTCSTRSRHTSRSVPDVGGELSGLESHLLDLFAHSRHRRGQGINFKIFLQL